MKILGINFGSSEIADVQNLDKKPRERRKVVKQIVTRELTRTAQTIKKWREWTDAAESKHNPNRVELYRLYKDVVLDAHLTS